MHCRACGSHFTSLEAFDAHRTGSHAENTRVCLDPATVTGTSAMTEVVGACRIANGRDHQHHHVSIWQLARRHNPDLAPQTGWEAAA
jgi:hypothetical protein